MTQLVTLPLWEWLALIAGVVLGVGPPSAFFGSKHAIKVCSGRHGCAMVEDAARESSTQNLRKELAAMHKANPELFSSLHRAMRKELAETGEHPAIPENARAKKDEEGQR